MGVKIMPRPEVGAQHAWETAYTDMKQHCQARWRRSGSSFVYRHSPDSRQFMGLEINAYNLGFVPSTFGDTELETYRWTRLEDSLL